MPVYLDYDQATLDRLLDPRSSAPNADAVQEFAAQMCEAARSSLPHQANATYGPQAHERLDIFPTVMRKPAPVMIFCHGGGWQRGNKESVALMAPLLTACGVALVTLDFAQVPAHSVAAMVAQVRRAIAWVHVNAASFGGDPAAIHVGGHSSGAHLAAMMLADDWTAELGLPANVIKSAVLVSGLYDLEPVRLSYRNAALGLDAESARELSPIVRLGHPRPLTCVYGTDETAEFRRQSEAFAAAAAAHGYATATFALPGCHHFNVLQLIAEGNTAATFYIVNQLCPQRPD